MTTSPRNCQLTYSFHRTTTYKILVAVLVCAAFVATGCSKNLLSDQGAGSAQPNALVVEEEASPTGSSDNAATDGLSGEAETILSEAPVAPPPEDVSASTQVDPTETRPSETAPSQRSLVLYHGKPFEICHAFLRGIREHNLETPGYCGVPLPSDDPDFSLLDWHLIDPMEHLNVIRDATILANYRRHNIGTDIERRRTRAHRFFESVDFPEDEIERFWSPYKARIQDLIRLGEVKLWVVNADTDFNGTKEPLYRMTQIVVAGSSSDRARKIWQERSGEEFPVSTMYPHCEDRGLTDDINSYFYYVSKNNSPSARRNIFTMGMGATHLDIFEWRKRIYFLGSGGSIYESTVLKPDRFLIGATGRTRGTDLTCGYIVRRNRGK